jgi:hypothetical protein
LLNPYALTEHPKGKQFTCPSGEYCLYITDLSETFSNQPVYSFGFEVIMQGERQYSIDHRISHTICKYLDDFFCQRDELILYVPADLDRKERARLRLFDTWFEKYKDDFSCRDLETCRYSFRYDDDKEFIVTIFYKSPQKAIAEKILYNELPELANQK